VKQFEEAGSVPDGRAIAQAVSRRLSTAAARVRAQVRSYGICGEQSGTGAYFLGVLRFPPSVLIPQNVPFSSSGAKKHWDPQQAKGLISGPSAKRTKDLLKLNRDHLKGHLFKMGLTDNPTCEMCLEEDESATHILCDCEAIANLRFRHLGQFFM
jgi:hypothetical protein